MRPVLLVVVFCCLQVLVSSQNYGIIQLFLQDQKCATAPGLFINTQLSQCVPDRYDNSSALMRLESATTVTVYKYSNSTECSGTPSNTTTLTAGQCSWVDNSGATISFSNNTYAPVTSPALQINRYLSCASTNEAPLTSLIYNPQHCFSENTTSLQYLTCNSTSFTLRNYEQSGCTGSYEDSVMAFHPCNDANYSPQLMVCYVPSTKVTIN